MLTVAWGNAGPAGNAPGTDCPQTSLAEGQTHDVHANEYGFQPTGPCCHAFLGRCRALPQATVNMAVGQERFEPW